MTTASENPTDKMQDMLCSLSRNWWAFVLRGVLALIIAVLAFVMPAESLLALTLVFGAFAFADGVFGLVAAIRNIRKGERWGWLMFSGILGIATGACACDIPLGQHRLLVRVLGCPRDRGSDPPAKGNRRRNLADPKRPSLGRSRCRRDLDAADAPARNLPCPWLASRFLRHFLRNNDDPARLAATPRKSDGPRQGS